jgi:uncharacterized protein YyaL (SSP411 family)
MRSYLLFRLYFPCFIIFLLFPSLCAYAQPAVEVKAALASLEKYRNAGEPACLKAGLESVERLIRGYGDGSVDAEKDMLAATAYAADMAYQATGDRKYLDFACRVAAQLAKEHESGPAGSMAAMVFMDLYHITGSEDYKNEAFKAARGLPEDSPAARKCRDTAYEFIVVGSQGDSGTGELIKKSFMFEEQCRVVVALDPVSDKARMDELGYEYRGEPVLYVCSENACFPPVIPGEGLKKTGEYIRKAKQLEKR